MQAYYKILPKYDGLVRKDGLNVVANELYTKSELKRYHIPEVWTTMIEVERYQCMWHFGMRVLVSDVNKLGKGERCRCPE